jgi:crossover junction endodeoxyribonuclease RuvC
MIYFLGVDPGATGAFAIIDRELDVYALGEFDKRDTVMELDRSVMKCVIEESQAMPGQGVSSTFKYGINFGMWLEFLRIHRIPYQRIRPSKWKKVICDGGPRKGKEGKDYSLELARRLFPSAADMLTRKKDNGRAEALLIAIYARDIWTGK